MAVSLPTFKPKVGSNAIKVGKKSGPRYRYFLVFQDKDISMTGAYPMSEFLKILAEL